MKHYRMDTSTFVAPGRHRHRTIAKREIEQPPAILLPALYSCILACRQIARDPMSFVSWLDSCHLVSLEKQTGTPMASPFETVAQGHYSTTVRECQQKNRRTRVLFR